LSSQFLKEEVDYSGIIMCSESRNPAFQRKYLKGILRERGVKET
jgi:hypothetical protein